MSLSQGQGDAAAPPRPTGCKARSLCGEPMCHAIAWGAVGPKEKPDAFFVRGTGGERRCTFCRGMEVVGKEDAESRAWGRHSRVLTV